MSGFDAWMEQRVAADPLPITVGGVAFLIPAEQPWAWVKFASKATDESVPEEERFVSNAETIAAVEALFSREVTRDRAGAPQESAGRKVWADYATSLGVEFPDKATKKDIRAACAVTVQQLDEFDALGLDIVAVSALLLAFVPEAYGVTAPNSDASDDA